MSMMYGCRIIWKESRILVNEQKRIPGQRSIRKLQVVKINSIKMGQTLLRYVQTCSPSTQVKAAAVHVNAIYLSIPLQAFNISRLQMKPVSNEPSIHLRSIATLNFTQPATTLNTSHFAQNLEIRNNLSVVVTGFVAKRPATMKIQSILDRPGYLSYFPHIRHLFYKT